ncbi:hypothetical protein [Arcobacter vandammei]|uniref:hypothetical protein n=3 Tax=Arcobacter vandammei TaxID=2782243 RepID=UPI0018DEF055|nr:hypothetical protein [Arcobacter vandammei]
MIAKNSLNLSFDLILKYLLDILNHRKFGFYFSLFYALILVLSFYPGILYSDSVPRWNLAIEFYKNGFSNFSSFSSHHPVIPSVLQSFFYGVTKEVGLFIFFQIFCFSYLIFKIVNKIIDSPYKNIIIIAILILPINYIYALFHSFDTLYAVLNLFLIYILLKLYEKYSNSSYIVLLITVFLLVSVRLNAILLAPIISIIFIYFIYRNNQKFNIKTITMSMLILVVAYSPFYITSSLNMKTSNSWVIGFAWEYANMGTKSKDSKHIEFMNSLGSNTDNIKNKICYNGIWCGNENKEFIGKVSKNDELSKKTFENYLDIFKNEPILFITEKFKYISSLMGIDKPLSNAEIAKWRNGNWAEQHKKLGFVTNENKEKIINEYFSFSKNITFMFEPYKIFVLGVLFLIYILFVIKKYFLPLALGFSISWLYYCTFFITSQNHELRYFFPVLLYSQVLFVIVISNLLSKFEIKKILILIISIIIIVFLSNKYYIYKEKENNILSNINNSILLYENNELLIKINPEKQKIVYFYKDCKNKDITTTFFLHLVPEDINTLPENRKQYAFDNLDFSWNTQALETPFWGEYKNSCIATKDLPKYKIKTIRTGQFNKDSRLWQTSIDLNSKIDKQKELQSFNLSDKNWANGISLSKSGFFIENNFLNRQSLSIGDKLKFNFSETRTITSLQYSSQYINIFVDGEKLDPIKDGYPNKILIIGDK